MKKFVALFRDIEIDVYAETQKEARKRAIAGLVSQLESEMVMCDGSVRTELCNGCFYRFEPCEMVRRDGENLCRDCNWDKYRLEDLNLNDIDIPF